MRSTKPNFFIVGAPQCGTTSLYEHLRGHPEVFMPHSDKRYWKLKEAHYFGEELITIPGLRIQNEHEYQALFDSVSKEQHIGEATALYLYSKEAPYRIKAYSPDAKIIILLKDPVEMMISCYFCPLDTGTNGCETCIGRMHKSEREGLGKCLE